MERKDYILRLINLNTVLDNLRTNINLICFNYTNDSNLKLNEKFNFDIVENNIKNIISEFNGFTDEKDLKKDEKKSQDNK